MSVVLAGVMMLQFRTDRYRAWVYWPAVTMISVVGTLITDSLVDTYGVPLALTTAVFAVLLTYGNERKQWLMGPVQALLGAHVQTLIDHPPVQVAPSFDLSKTMEKVGTVSN